MNKRKKKKFRKKIYKTAIENVALEISIDSTWRDRIFSSPMDEKLEITYLCPENLPIYVRDEILLNNLEFWASKVRFCKEHFDSNLVIFKFESKEYPDIVRFTGNNSSVV